MEERGNKNIINLGAVGGRDCLLLMAVAGYRIINVNTFCLLGWRVTLAGSEICGVFVCPASLASQVDTGLWKGEASGFILCGVRCG
jgi:hypothetical protein